ncbi:PREDICTED: protein BTG2 [Tinamus guttatus]|nr:PREDICTED: protein BTG2 [Tinamus guttatus]
MGNAGRLLGAGKTPVLQSGDPPAHPRAPRRHRGRVTVTRRGRGDGSRAAPHRSSSLAEHYKHHWFPEKPFKGSGYRCIRINHKMDPIISKAASHIGLSLPQLYQLLPSELTLWVDPYEVSYRIGEDGSICVLYEAAATKPGSSYGLLTCKNQMMLGRTSPSKNYIMTVSS